MLLTSLHVATKELASYILAIEDHGVAVEDEYTVEFRQLRTAVGQYFQQAARG